MAYFRRKGTKPREAGKDAAQIGERTGRGGKIAVLMSGGRNREKGGRGGKTMGAANVELIKAELLSTGVGL